MITIITNLAPPEVLLWVAQSPFLWSCYCLLTVYRWAWRCVVHRKVRGELMILHKHTLQTAAIIRWPGGKAPDLWLKGHRFGPQQAWQQNLLFQSTLSVLTLIQLLPYPSISPVTAVAWKRHWLFCQKCRWQVTAKYACTFDPMKSKRPTMLFCHSVKTRKEMSLHTICLGTLIITCLSSLSHCELILAWKHSSKLISAHWATVHWS